METSTEIYRVLYLSIKSASDIEHTLQQQSGRGNNINSTDKILKQLNDIASTELPACMGKMISQLELQGTFQALGRYVRNFDDAEFVVRNLKEQIINSLLGSQMKFAGSSINDLISCSNSYADEFEKILSPDKAL